jgi:carbamoyl-phosphate synthase large subunit
LPIVQGFHSLGYGVYATEGTASFLESQGIKVIKVTKKLGEGHPNVIDVINDGLVAGVVNTITGGRVPLQDGFHIRRAAAERRIPCFTSLDTARVALQAIMNGTQLFSVHRLREYLDGGSTS